jgi:site-specific recombinase XerD
MLTSLYPSIINIREWREKQAEEIAKRDEASAKRKAEIIERAEKAIDDFYSTYNQKKEKQIAQNKENEAAFVQARDDALAKGTTWERIADFIELQDSRSKTVARGHKDLGRFKEVLLTLKREGDTAPNAAGY